MPVPEESKSRQGRKKKGSSQVKSTSPAVNEVVQLAEDTAVQDQDHFNRPHNPAPTKSCVKQIPGRLLIRQVTEIIYRIFAGLPFLKVISKMPHVQIKYYGESCETRII